MRASAASASAAAAALVGLALLAAPPAAHALGPFGRPTPKHRHFTGATPRAPPARPLGQPGSANCTTRWMTQDVDHFSWLTPPPGNPTYQQRYLTYDGFYRPGGQGVVYFYAGNEADVTLYADHTGLMWENAQAAGAYIVFAEHRYYGLSQPFGNGSAEASLQWPQYLTHEQASADYAALAGYVRSSLLGPGGEAVPFVLFGGSYGGMMATWTRIKYPAVFDAAVAASAPILAFQGMQTPYDTQSYWRVVTRDATAAAGANPQCAQYVTDAFSALWAQAALGPAALAKMSAAFDLCTPLQTQADVNALAFFHMGAWDTMAMGNYPYPSNYLTGGGSNPALPPWPVRAACDIMAAPSVTPSDPYSLLAALNAASGVFNNGSGTVECYAPPGGDGIWEDAVWDIQWCTEALPEETYFARAGGYPAPGGDMFWPFAWSPEAVAAHCQNSFGFSPRFDWISTSYGTTAAVGVERIVFSNGEYDPWSSGGVNVSTPALPTVWVAEGAHHLDLFFSNPQDPPSVTAARQQELAYIRGWTEEARAERRKRFFGAEL